MKRLRITDRASGDVLLETDSDEPALTSSSTHDEAQRAMVLAAARPSTVRGRTAVDVVLAGWQFELEVEDASLAALRQRATSTRAGSRHHGPTEVRAIIPGRIVSVDVQIGTTVEPGQRLLAVEAMKMENELRTPRAGVVERVDVAVDQNVELGEILVVIR
jgi:biotin carboxyl carrier protein